MKKWLSDKEFENMMNEYDKIKHICKCGHRVIMPKWIDKKICGWCGEYVFKDKKTEFEYRMNEQMKRRHL